MVMEVGNDSLKGNIDTASTPEKKSGIQSSLTQRMMAVKLSSVQVREWFQRQKESIQPWGEFLNGKKFRVPKSVAPVGQRVVKNFTRFQSNYMFVFLGLLAFCLLTSPVLLLALAACLGACYIISIKNAERKITIMGREITVAQQYAVVAIASFPLFWFAGAGSAVFWVIGASIFVIVLHSSMYSIEEEAQPFDLQMEAV